MDEYIDVKIDVFEHTGQRARVRKSLTTDDLISEILREFDDIVADSPEKYAIYLKGFDRPLKRDNNMTQLDIQPQDELVFDYVRQTIRKMLDVSQYAVLREEATGKEFDIQWQPAVIGRPSTEVDHNIILAVNVTLLPNGNTVSRKHAQITFSEGHYFVEPLADQNPVFLNGRELPINNRREIKSGDKISLGRHKLTLTFAKSQTASRTDRRESGSPSTPRPAASVQPVSTPIPPPARSVTNNADATSLADAPIIPSLVIEASAVSDKVGGRIELSMFPFTIGRSLEILSKENEVSRKHAEISYDAKSSRYYISDLQSTNGVTINGQRVAPGTPYEIISGTRIGLGSILILKFEV